MRRHFVALDGFPLAPREILKAPPASFNEPCSDGSCLMTIASPLGTVISIVMWKCRPSRRWR
jgi:hypothetical protein